MNKHHTPKRPNNSLGILAVLLLLSGVVRLSDQQFYAFAQDAANTNAETGADSQSVAGVPFDASAIETILAALKAREERLLEREAELQEVETRLSASEVRITAKIAELTEVEEKLASTLALADTAAEDDLTRLATVYENMKPKDTAALFSEMAPGFAAGFLGLMQPEAAAAVMTELEPQTAHTISVMLAGRNANAFNPQ